MSMGSPKDVSQSIEEQRDIYSDIAKQIWGFAEVGYQEEKSSQLLKSVLEEAGFEIESGVAEIPTAFVASYGQGKPVIAILAEYDALPGLSQEVSTEKNPIVENGPGHGCGHHLFGTASTAAAIAVKDWLASSNTPGTIRLYGTPAEEGGSGKVYMVREGLFDDVDVAFACR
jgi:aminobenzoyl-glutamate utilization protein B